MTVKRAYRAARIAEAVADTITPHQAIGVLYKALIDRQHARIKTHIELVSLGNGQADEIEAMIEAARDASQERIKFEQFSRWMNGALM